MLRAILFLIGIGAATEGALAAETSTYAYDALGRLITTTRASGPSNGVSTAIGYDPADNRSSYVVTGSSRPPITGPVIVLPLNGFTVIPLPIN